MLLKKAFFLTFILTLLLLSACSSGEDADNTTNAVAMPVILSIPATDGPMTSRAGDPGDYEHFKLPRYAYIYIICKDMEGKDFVVHSVFNLNDKDWASKILDNGDSAYQYNGNIKVYLPIERQAEGKVYAALSYVPLGGLPSRSNGSSETESTVNHYKYAVTKDVIDELANIYSTPYNYRPDGNTYYGTINNLNSLTPSLNLVLYHVASKLDIQWNVGQQLQSSAAINSMTLTVPSVDSAYIFRPLRTAPNTTTDEQINITVGNQWYGRDYKYVLPLTGDNDTYTFTATMNMTDGSTRSQSIVAGVIIKTNPFTPWMRGRITIGN